MDKGLITKKEIEINAGVESVWNSLIQPELIKQYLFCTEVISEWKTGSPIIFRGTWEGKPYEDKALVLKSEKNKVLEYAYWTSLSGLEDKVENYAIITYELVENDRSTLVGVTQDNIGTPELFNRISQSWDISLKGLKETIEKRGAGQLL